MPTAPRSVAIRSTELSAVGTQGRVRFGPRQFAVLFDALDLLCRPGDVQRIIGN